MHHAPVPLQITLGAQPFQSPGSTAHGHPTITLKTHGQGRYGGLGLSGAGRDWSGLPASSS